MASPPRPASRATRRLRRVLAGAHPALPRPVDAAAEAWASWRPRTRVAIGVLLALTAGLALGARVQAAEGRWGGPPVRALVATEDLAVGADPTGRVRVVRLPPDALPASPLHELPDRPLALAAPRGAVLTELHVERTGPSAGLPDELRALPVAVQESWGITAGAWVDVWVLDAHGSPELVAASRPVLELRGEGHDATALLGLAVAEVTAVTGALGQGRVVLAHAPPPVASPR